jgi:hypothetical protein
MKQFLKKKKKKKKKKKRKRKKRKRKMFNLSFHSLSLSFPTQSYHARAMTTPSSPSPPSSPSSLASPLVAEPSAPVVKRYPWLIVGIGNPGNKFLKTRHNVSGNRPLLWFWIYVYACHCHGDASGNDDDDDNDYDDDDDDDVVVDGDGSFLPFLNSRYVCLETKEERSW